MTVQQTIIKGIKELLYSNNYLVLPNFGGFVLKTGTSHFSGSGTSLVPPSKTVSFNAQLKQNDSVLAIWLENKLQCNPAQAIAHLHDFAEFCSTILTTRRRLSLDGIGFFYLDFENNISFEPQNDANFLTDSFGLAPIHLKEIEIKAPEVKTAAQFTDRTIAFAEVPAVVKPKRNYQRLVAPVIFLTVLFSLLIVFVSNNKISGPLRASVFGAESKGSYQPLAYPALTLLVSEKENTAYVADANGIATVKLNNKVIAVKAIELLSGDASVKSRYVSKRSASAANGFEIVLGCFTVFENANKMAEKISSENLRTTVSDKNEKGMYVVSSGSYATRDDALADLMVIKNRFPKAWIKQP